MLDVLERCVKAGQNSIEEAKDKMPDPAMVQKQ